VRVFVLTTGRTGSVTYAHAAAHATNFTAGHETRGGVLQPDRLEYPDDHIEVDNRLSWFLGSLHRRYGDDAGYVHLLRDEDAVARSYEDRWPDSRLPRRKPIVAARKALGYVRGDNHASLPVAFSQGIVMRKHVAREERFTACKLMVRTINDNVALFLRERPNSLVVDLEDGADGFERVWERFGLQGDLDGALAEFHVRHNPSKWRLTTPDARSIASSSPPIPADPAESSHERLARGGSS
jgi:hypothetical protein